MGCQTGEVERGRGQIMKDVGAWLRGLWIIGHRTHAIIRDVFQTSSGCSVEQQLEGAGKRVWAFSHSEYDEDPKTDSEGEAWGTDRIAWVTVQVSEWCSWWIPNDSRKTFHCFTVWVQSASTYLSYYYSVLFLDWWKLKDWSQLDNTCWKNLLISFPNEIFPSSYILFCKWPIICLVNDATNKIYIYKWNGTLILIV